MIRPIRKQVLVKCFESDNISEGGIIVPDALRKPSNKVTIVDVGRLVTKVKKGEIGFRVKDWGEEIYHEGQQYFIMNEDAIIARQ